MPASSAMTAPRITNHRAGSALPFLGNPGPPIMAVTIGENTSTATIAAASVRSGGTRTPISRRTPNANNSTVRAAPMTSTDQDRAVMASSGPRAPARSPSGFSTSSS
jgi:hypothetical protein